MTRRNGGWTTIGLGLATLLSSPVLGGAAGPEFGLRGLKRVELEIREVRRERFVAGIMAGDAAPDGSVPVPSRDGKELANDPECLAIKPALARAGLDVVDRCPPGDAACGRFSATMETSPVQGTDDAVLLSRTELHQPLRLARDPAIELTAPVTWSEPRIGIVKAGHSATRTSCRELRDLATWFASIWKAANE